MRLIFINTLTALLLSAYLIIYFYIWGFYCEKNYGFIVGYVNGYGIIRKRRD